MRLKQKSVCVTTIQHRLCHSSQMTITWATGIGWSGDSTVDPIYSPNMAIRWARDAKCSLFTNPGTLEKHSIKFYWDWVGNFREHHIAAIQSLKLNNYLRNDSFRCNSIGSKYETQWTIWIISGGFLPFITILKTWTIQQWPVGSTCPLRENKLAVRRRRRHPPVICWLSPEATERVTLRNLQGWKSLSAD